ncbi:MAG TPA: HK97 gp10 family phage protein [Rummeliibacillus sp.]|nr:HK97 gp10 family phage protein [Rummeliibacillus sp.]
MAVKGVYKTDEIAQAIMDELIRYAKVVDEDVQSLAKKVAEEGAYRLSVVSPEGATGNYKTGWTVKKVEGKYVVHNKTDYQLTHLLEKGHAKVNGGRVDARPHIKPVEEEMIDEFVNGIEKMV